MISNTKNKQSLQGKDTEEDDDETKENDTVKLKKCNLKPKRIAHSACLR